jgi:DNA-binding GntR family transcriptional regulator
MKLLEKIPGENARTYAVRVLMDNIIRLELKPGSAVSENELSVQMELSRTPVREALIELNKLGLVDIFPKRGSYITKIDYDLIEEARFMRLTLEVAVMRLLCENGITDEYIRKMSDNLSLYKEILQEEDYASLLELDNEFHRLIFEAANKMRTYEVVHKQMVHFDRLRALSLQTSLGRTTLNDHENILYALKKKDAELAELVMTQHLTRHRMEREELVKLYPDYFVS